MREQRNTNQWTCTGEVVKWFIKLEDKKLLNFVKFDIVDYYPSITEDIL